MFEPDVEVVVELLREGMSRGKTPFLTITSGSMIPLLRAGDQVAIEWVEPTQLSRGDVIVVKDKKHLVTHRYWGTVLGSKDNQLLRTRGDRLLSYDPFWSIDCYVGKVILRRRIGNLLYMDGGPGRWLNRQLMMAASLEDRIFIRSQASQTSVASRRLPTKLVRGMLLSYATLLATIATKIAGMQSRGKMSDYRTVLLVSFFVFGMVLILPSDQVWASVELSDFYAESSESSITLRWVTVDELDNLGFNLWRGEGCDPDIAMKLNATAIPSQVGGQPTGATYEFVDSDVQPEVVYDYRLESLDRDGNTECHYDFPVQTTLADGEVVVAPSPTVASPTPAPTSTSGGMGTPQPSASAISSSAPTTTGIGTTVTSQITGTNQLTATNQVTATSQLTTTSQATNTRQATATSQVLTTSDATAATTRAQSSPTNQPPDRATVQQLPPTPTRMTTAIPQPIENIPPFATPVVAVTDTSQTMASPSVAASVITATASVTPTVQIIGTNNDSSLSQSTTSIVEASVELNVIGEGYRLERDTENGRDVIREDEAPQNKRVRTVAIMVFLMGITLLIGGSITSWYCLKSSR